MSTTSNFGKYVLLRKLASGGMGEVFLAKQHGPSGFEKLLVIKRILSHHLDKPDYVEMFFGEAKLVARLNHPNIIQIHEMGEIRGEHYIAMEYVRGKSLRDIIDALRAEGRSMPLAHVVELAVKLCDGLGYAHQARDASERPLNIVHRDVNPHNVLVSYNGDLKIIDFGIAKSEMTSVHTATGTIKGKFVYMSPEQSAADPLDKRSDIFSLGIVIYELAALENPFVRQNVVLSLEAIQRHAVPLPSAKRPEAALLDHVLSTALAKRPEDRFQSAFELRDALRDLLVRGDIPPADQSLSSSLQSLFAADIDRDAALLDLAERELVAGGQAGRLPSDLRLVPVDKDVVPFGDEEPTVSSDVRDIAASRHRVAPLPSVSDVERVPPALRSDVITPVDEPARGRARPVSAVIHAPELDVGEVAFDEARLLPDNIEAPARPRSADPDGRPPALRSDVVTPVDGPAHDEGNAHTVFPPIRDHDALSLSDMPGGSLPSGSLTGDSLAGDQLGGATPVAARSDVATPVAALAEPLPATAASAAPIDTEDALPRLEVPWRRLGRVAAYASVLLITAVFGFLATRYVLGPGHTPRVGVISQVDAKANAPSSRSGEDLRAAADLTAGATGRAAVEPTENPPTGRAIRRAQRRISRAQDRNDRGATGAAPSAPSLSRSRQTTAVRKAALRRSPKAEAKRPKPRVKTAPRRRRLVSRPRLGGLTVRANQDVQIALNDGQRTTATTTLAIRKKAGTLSISSGQLKYAVTLSYRVSPRGIAVRVDTQPWALVWHEGIALGRTPRGPLEASFGHAFTFRKPGQDGELVLSLKWKPQT